MKSESQIKLDHIELFYKFALAASSTIISSEVDLKYYGLFTFLSHSVTQQELELTKDEEKIGAQMLEFIGTYMLALQLNEILEKEWGSARLQSPDSEILSISQVVRLIRNAFAHAPLYPIWDISKSAQDQEFNIPTILTLRTHNLHGVKVERRHYGGPLALLKLIQYVRTKL